MARNGKSRCAAGPAAAGPWIRFIRSKGIVLEAGRGPVPALAEAVAGESIRGSWWAHPKSHAIFQATRAVRDHRDVLVCRLVQGKVTFVHRRLWPAIVAAAPRLPRKRLARIAERHSPTGRHVVHETPFPDWVPPAIHRRAERMDIGTAIRLLGPAAAAARPARRGAAG
jgi:hypothetical protein